MIYLGQDPIGISNIPESYPELVQDVSRLNKTIDKKADAIYRDVSGDIVTITDGAEGMPLKECTVQIDPVQDLHGYDNPWPAGGGIQLIPYPGYESMPVTKNGVTITDIGNGRVHIQGTATSIVYFNFYGNSSTPIPAWVKPNTQYTLRPVTVSSKYFVQFILYGSTAYTATGSTFTTPNDLSGYTGFAIVLGIYNGAEVNADISPMLEYGATAHDFAPYSNICPITGHTGAQIRRTGKNLLDKSSYSLLNNQIILWGGGATGDADGSFVLAPGTYTFSCGEACNGLYVYNSTSRIAVVYNQTAVSFTISEITPIKLHAYISGSSSSAIYARNYQLEHGSTATPYTPYIGSIYPISWQTAAGTVYGGTVDPVTGVLTVDRVFVEIDGTNKAVVFHKTGSAATAFRYGIVESADYADGTKDQISNYLHKASQDQTANGKQEYAVYANNGTLYLTLPLEIEDADDANAYLAQHNLQVVYYLVTPRTIQLDPVEISTLMGENNLWADTGAISLTYPADTKTYVDESLPAVPVQDVQINETSILVNGVANVPIASSSDLGVVKVNPDKGTGIEVDTIIVRCAISSDVKTGQNQYKPIVPNYQHHSVFYGLAKAAGADMASSSNAVGTYTDAAKTAIQTMLGVESGVSFVEQVTGTTPAITGIANTRYICGEVTSISVTPPVTGIIDVTFTSGTTPAVLTIPNTVTFPAWFDPTSLDANKVYEINIVDGVRGVVTTW